MASEPTEIVSAFTNITGSQPSESILSEVKIWPWVGWIIIVVLVRAIMVEWRMDGARFGIIGCCVGALQTIGHGWDKEWSMAYERLRPIAPPKAADANVQKAPSTAIDAATRDPPPSPPDADTQNTGPIPESALDAQESVTINPDAINAMAHIQAHWPLESLYQKDWKSLQIHDQLIPAWDLDLHKRLWFRWFVDELRFRRMFWFGNSEPGPDNDAAPPQRPRYRANWARSSVKDTTVASQNHPDQLTLVYGTRSIDLPEGSGRLDGRQEDFVQNRNWKAVRYSFYFGLFGIGLALRSTMAGLLATAILELLLGVSWFLVDQARDPKETHFCTRVARSADQIEAAAFKLVPMGIGEGGGGRRTLDVLLVYGETASWCRCSPTLQVPLTKENWDDNTWISLCIPTRAPFWDYVFNLLGLVAHTLLPWGWVCMTPNLIFAGIAVTLEASQPGLGLLAIPLTCLPSIFGWPLGVWQHEDNWTFAWYAMLFEWLNGHTVSSQLILAAFEKVSTLVVPESGA